MIGVPGDWFSWQGQVQWLCQLKTPWTLGTMEGWKNGLKGRDTMLRNEWGLICFSVLTPSFHYSNLPLFLGFLLAPKFCLLTSSQILLFETAIIFTGRGQGNLEDQHKQKGYDTDEPQPANICRTHVTGIVGKRC